MCKNTKKQFMLLVLVLISSVLCLNADADNSKKVPDFTLRDLSGAEVSLSQYKGKVVLIDFWATWCGPCRMSIPELVDLHKRYEDKGLAILGISMDKPGRTDDRKIADFIKKFNVKYKVMRTDQKVNRLFFGDPNARSAMLPTFFIIGRDGMAMNVIKGYSPGAIEKVLKKIF